MKNEIADVSLNQIPSGYKQTEVGLIPEDWDLVSLQNMAIQNGLVRGPFGGSIKKEHFTKTGYKVYEQRNAIYGTIDIGNYYIDQKKFDELKRFSVSHNDFIISCSGTIGRIYQIPDKYPKGVINQALLKITLNNSIDSKYFYHYFKWDAFQARIIDGTQGGAMKNLVGMAEFKQSLMPLPTAKEEQTAIANALSDVDALICELEKLITKKQAIKIATMQQLLTGRTRLPQFALREDGSKKGTKQSDLGEIPEDWEVKTVFELVGCQKNLFDDGDWIEAEHITNNGIRLIQTGNIGVGRYVEKDLKKYIYEESFEKLKCKELHEGDLLICRLAEPAGRACILPYIGEDKVITSVDVTIFRPSDKVVNRNFYNQYFSSSGWFKAVLEQVGGTTHKRISRGALGRIGVCYPSVDEQTAIATILSDMDEEIQSLEHRLSKTRQIKQGMMQELLTGRTRLV